MRNITILIFSLFLFIGCKESFQCEKEIYLLPPGFRGELIVYFDQPDGLPIEYEDDARVYRIPKSGFLKSQFKKNGGCMTENRIRFYYLDGMGKGEEIDYFLNLEKDCIPLDRDYVLFTFLSNDKKPDFVIHLVGNIGEFNKLTGGVRNLDPVKILESL